eukprot:gene8684-631_t
MQTNHRVLFKNKSFDSSFPQVLQDKLVPEELYEDTLVLLTEKIKSTDENYIKVIFGSLLLVIIGFIIPFIFIPVICLYIFFIKEVWANLLFVTCCNGIIVTIILNVFYFRHVLSSSHKRILEKKEFLRQECYKDSVKKYKKFGIQILIKFDEQPSIFNTLGTSLEILSIDPNEVIKVELIADYNFKFDKTYIYLLEENEVTETHYLNTMKHLEAKMIGLWPTKSVFQVSIIISIAIVFCGLLVGAIYFIFSSNTSIIPYLLIFGGTIFLGALLFSGGFFFAFMNYQRFTMNQNLTLLMNEIYAQSEQFFSPLDVQLKLKTHEFSQKYRNQFYPNTSLSLLFQPKIPTTE